MSRFQSLQAIVFDFDGVIADSERLHLRAFQEVLADRNVTLSEREYYERYLGFDDEGVFRTLARAHAWSMNEAALHGLIEAKALRYERLTASENLLYPGAARFIREAADAVPIAVASGALTREIEDILDRAGIRACFSALVGADQTARSKPAPDPYLEALARLEGVSDDPLQARRIVAIEDSHWGLESAKAAGLRCVAVTTTYDERELAGAAELTFSSLEAMNLDALDTLCRS